ncbi:MAG: peptide/nickel transport system permease protein, partial [Thermomicrobiales bacterium]|nr:peptide/nickel transport system permease protein [Thermomicrobiales bacterium]
ATIIVILSVMALFAPQLAPHPYAEQDLLDSLLKPLSPDHLLGTDQFGRDVFSRIIWGARVSMQVGLIVTTISMVVGLVIGCLAGYYGGFVDLVLSNLIDLVWGFPLILVALLLVTVMGPGLDGAMIATGLVAWSGFARIVRGEVVALREWGFIVAAQALGAGDVRIILRHILPNMLGPVMVMASFTMAAAVIIEASLSFLGLGAQPPQPSWGSMLNDGRAVIHRAYWMAVFPGVAIAMLVLGFNLLGDGLRDVLDPRMRRR